MKGSRHLILSLLLTLGLASTAGAATPDAVAPPGNSAVDQYRESVPPASTTARKPSSSERRELARQGQDGRDLADVLERSGGVPTATAEATRDAEASGDQDADGSTTVGGSGSAAASSGGASSTGTTTATSGVSRDPLPVSAVSTSLGPFPIWVMMIAAVVLIAGAAVVRRGRST